MNFEILINQFGQNLISEDRLLEIFGISTSENKRKILQNMHYLILQSKPLLTDIEKAINLAKLKPTYTPCVILNKGLTYNNFNKIIALPENELLKAFKLFIFLFKVAYKRRYIEEKNNPDKWWYWDLSNSITLQKIQHLLNKNTKSSTI